jgi:hypothetical protein
MFNDIENTLSLDSLAPNFLLALGLCCYTEYWGKLKLGVKPKEKGVKNHLKNFFTTILIPFIIHN